MFESRYVLPSSPNRYRQAPCEEPRLGNLRSARGNLIRLGPLGVGTTHVSVTLGISAIEHDYGVYDH